MVENLFKPGALFATALRLQSLSIPMPMRVLQIHGDSAWEYGVADFLRQESGLKVKSVLASNEPTLLNELTRFNPNVILMNADVQLSLAHLRLWPSDQLAQSLVRLIVTSLRNNFMDVYDAHGKRQVVVRHIADLSRCIRG